MSLYTTHHVAPEGPPTRPIIVDLLNVVAGVSLLAAIIAGVFLTEADKQDRAFIIAGGVASLATAIGAIAAGTIIKLLWQILQRASPERLPASATSEAAAIAPTAPPAKEAKAREAHALSPIEEAARVAARQEELDRRLADIEANVADPTERQRLKLRAIADYC